MTALGVAKLGRASPPVRLPVLGHDRRHPPQGCRPNGGLPHFLPLAIPSRIGRTIPARPRAHLL
jgi:hypothetical protein